MFNKPQKMIRNTNVDDMHLTANDAKPLLPAGADFGNGIFLYNEDCLQALRKLNDK